MLNLGQGVAWDEWYGRGTRSNHSEDYPKYIEGCDIVSFDIYPVAHDDKRVADKLEFVARGVERLRRWTEGTPKVVWNCIECTHISNPEKKASPMQIRAEVWMSLIQGSRGLIYFVHEFKPRFKEAGLLDDPITLEAVSAINHQILQLAPVLNQPTVAGAAQVVSHEGEESVSLMVKRYKNTSYLFAVEMSGKNVSVEFSISAMAPATKAEVLGENRTVNLGKNRFRDAFSPWAVHLYKFAE